MTARRAVTQPRFGSAALAGAIAGQAGGVVFGMLPGMSQMTFVIGQPQDMSPMGHILYGVITALVFVPLSRRL